jgi:hypothetical protein
MPTKPKYVAVVGLGTGHEQSRPFHSPRMAASWANGKAVGLARPNRPVEWVVVNRVTLERVSGGAFTTYSPTMAHVSEPVRALMATLKPRRPRKT